MSNRISTVIKAVTDLPARLFGGNAQTVEVSGLDYTLHLDLEKLPPFTPAEAPGKWTVIWDETTNQYRRVEFTNLPPPLGSLGLDAEAVDDRVAQLIKAGANVAIVYDDAGNRLTIHSIAPGGSTGPQNVFDTIVDARLATIPAAVKVITLSGYNRAGDAGPAMPCRRTPAMVTKHKGVFRSTDRYTDTGVEDFANGGWWEYVGNNQPIWTEWFGAVADYHLAPTAPGGIYTINPTPTDNHQSIMDAIQFIYVYYDDVMGAGTGYKPNFAAGGTIQLGYGSYYCSDTIRSDRGICLRGMGNGYYHDYSCTRVFFPPGKTGVRLDPPAVDTSGNVYYGAGSIIQDIFFAATAPGGAATAHGLDMKQASEIRGCTFVQFGGNGIDLSADVYANPGTNANCFFVSHCFCHYCGKNGVYCHGGDSNAGTVIATNCMYSGEYGFWDDSFLGNVFIGCHTQGNTLGGFYSGHQTRTAWIGCYKEDDNAGTIGAFGTVIGGHMQGMTFAKGSVSIWNGNLMGHNLLYGADNPADAALDKLGIVNRYRANFIQSLYANVPGAGFFGHHWCFEPDQGLFTWRYGDVSDVKRWAYAITTEQQIAKFGRAEAVGPCNFALPNGLFLGGDPTTMYGSGFARFFGFVDHYSWQFYVPGANAPPGPYAKGDTRINYQVGTTEGWYGNHWADTCIEAGCYTPLVWVSGTTYVAGHYVKNLGTKFYHCITPGPGTSTVQPTHASGENAPGADGYVWRWVADQPSKFKRFGTLMGDYVTTVNDPIFNVWQTWNNAAVAFVGNRTNITDTASHTDSMLEEWCVGGTRKASIRKDGTFLSNGVPVVMVTELDELRATIATLQDRVAALEAR